MAQADLEGEKAIQQLKNLEKPTNIDHGRQGWLYLQQSRLGKTNRVHIWRWLLRDLCIIYVFFFVPRWIRGWLDQTLVQLQPSIQRVWMVQSRKERKPLFSCVFIQSPHSLPNQRTRIKLKILLLNKFSQPILVVVIVSLKLLKLIQRRIWFSKWGWWASRRKVQAWYLLLPPTGIVCGRQKSVDRSHGRLCTSKIC